MDAIEAFLAVSLASTVPLIGGHRDAYRHLCATTARASLVVVASYLVLAYLRLPLEVLDAQQQAVLDGENALLLSRNAPRICG